MKLLILNGDSPRHLYFADQLMHVAGVESLSLVPHRLGSGRLGRMLLRQPRTFLARVGKYAAYSMMRWTARERVFFGNPSGTLKTNRVEDLNAAETIAIAKEFAPDMLAAFGVPIISDELISIPRWGAVNLHGGISPQYKGGNTIFWPLYEGKPEMAGATIHYMVSKVDSGRLLAKVYPALDASDDECSASCKTFRDATDEFVRLVEWARDHALLPEGVAQTGASHLYKAVRRGLFVSLRGRFAIPRRMRGVALPARVERFYE